MPRPRKQAPGLPELGDDESIISKIESVLGKKMAEIPASIVNGKPNLGYYWSLMDRINTINEYHLLAGVAMPSYQQAVQGVIAQAELVGFSKRQVVDRRSENDKAIDAFDRLTNGESLLEVDDGEINALESIVKNINVYAQDWYDARCRDLDADADASTYSRDKAKAEARAKMDEGITQGKRLAGLIVKLRWLRNQARNPFPEGSAAWQSIPLKAAHPLRFAAYVMRSNTSDAQHKGGSAAMMQFANHHYSMSFAVMCARDKYEFGPYKTRLEVPYEGAIIVLPPEHGKSTMAFALYGLRISMHPYTKLIILHAKADMAEKNLGYLASMFKTDNAMGRRRNALFPLELAECNQTTFRLRLPQVSKSPTAFAAGIGSAQSGSDASDIWFDDVVDQEASIAQAERNRTFERMTGTFMSRLRGKNGFHLTTNTLWHHDDANARRISMARRQSNPLMVKVYIASCGGPDTSPKFKALWPEVCPTTKLKGIYNQNPALYRIAYMSDATPDEQRLVKKVRLYDPETSEHAEFMKDAKVHLSIDPAATARERSDKAGVVCAAMGTLRWKTRNESGAEVQHAEYRLRIISSRVLQATQSDLMQFIVQYALDNEIDHIHIETVGAFAGLAERMEEEFACEVIRHTTQNKSKKIRLQSAATYLEDVNAGMSGHRRAVVEFPGVLNDAGVLEHDASVNQLIREVLDFGTIGSDHSVDALSQLVNHLAPYLAEAGDGEASGNILAAIRGDVETPMLKMLRELRERHERDEGKGESAQEEDFRFRLTGVVA